MIGDRRCRTRRGESHGPALFGRRDSPPQTSAVIAGFLPIAEAAELTNIGILLAFVVVCAAVIVLRYRRPDLPRSFRTPWMPVVPAVGIVASIWLITYLQWQTWVRFAAWFVIGVVIYFGYSYQRSEPARGQSAAAAGAADDRL